MEYTVESYDTETGMFWRIMNQLSKEVIADGFDSSADAEAWIYDNLIK